MRWVWCVSGCLWKDTTHQSMTALHHAARVDQSGYIVELLLGKGWDLMAVTSDGDTVLHLLAR